MIKHLPILLIVIPLLAAFIVPLAGKLNKTLSWALTVAATFVSFIISLVLLNTVNTSGMISYWLGGWEPPWGIELLIDYLNAFVLVIIAFIVVVTAIYALKSVSREIKQERIPFFYSLYLLFSAGLMGIVITGDVFNLYVFLEIMSISGYALIGIGQNREALYGSFKYLIMGTIGATLILLGIGHLYLMTGTLNMHDLAQRLPDVYDSRVVLTGFIFIAVGLSLKIALFPLHTWLPRAYAYAPSAVSTVMAATATKVSAYVLIRFIFTIFNPGYMSAGGVSLAGVFIFFSVVAIIMGSVLAVAQTDFKKLLAYSSIGQIGYIVMGVFLLNSTGLQGALLHILNHALMKGTLFMVAGAIVYKAGITSLEGLKGMGKKMPVSMAAFTAAALSMIGVPLTVGFVSKWYLALASLEAGMWYLIPVILLSSILMAVYFWRIVDNIYFKHSEGEETRIEEAPAGMTVPAVLTAGLCVVFGIMAYIPVSFAEKAATFLVR